MNLESVTVGQMSGYDVGRRIVVTDQGIAVDGILSSMTTTRSDYDFKDRDRVMVSITVKRLDGDTTIAELNLKQLPLDYLVERELMTPEDVDV